jgi:xylose isomerase
MRHAICRWTFNPGHGGFVPGDIRPAWADLTTADFVRIVGEKVRPRLPDDVELGIEAHYDTEVDESSAADVVAALDEQEMSLAMMTPGAHAHWAYGGSASPDQAERRACASFGRRAVDIAYGPLRPAWSDVAPPSLILWNGSWGYDLPGPWVRSMLDQLEEELAGLMQYEQEKGGEMYVCIEPKPNEGHPKMLLPTVASALVMRRKLADRGLDVSRFGTNKEFGHSEMVGLDVAYDTAEELREGAIVHVHANSQGYDGIRHGGPGMYDVDHGCAIVATSLATAKMLLDAGYDRWIGHDMQPRPYDNEEQAIDRVVRSVINWEAMIEVAKEMNVGQMTTHLSNRETAKVEDLLGAALCKARGYAAEMLS